MVFILACIDPELKEKTIIHFNNQTYYVSVEDAQSTLNVIKQLGEYNEKYLRIIPMYLT